jgi:hypothetical protein
LSDVHCDPPQTPLSQTNVQQSCGIVQEEPAVLQSAAAQTLVCVSQFAVQQSALLAHVVPT